MIWPNNIWKPTKFGKLRISIAELWLRSIGKCSALCVHIFLFFLKCRGSFYEQDVSHNKKIFLWHFLTDLIPMGAKCDGKRKSLSVTLGLHRNNIYKEVSQKENVSFCDTSCSDTLPLYWNKTLLKLWKLSHLTFCMQH